MPLFEYECRDCRKPFEAFVTADRTAACPACEGTNLKKLLSRLGMVGVASPRSEGCGMPSSPMCGGGLCGAAEGHALLAPSHRRRFAFSRCRVPRSSFPPRRASLLTKRSRDL